MGTPWSLAFPWAAWAAAGPELQCWAQLSPAVSSFVPAALPALRADTSLSQGLKWGDLGPGIWEETEVCWDPVCSSSWESRALAAQGTPGLLSSLTQAGHAQGLLLTPGMAAWDRDSLGQVHQ